MISILIPIKDEAKYIAECLDSILQQSIEDWEVILVDDFSTDNTYDVLNERNYLSDKRIRYIENEVPGVVGALQTGVKYCKGEFITRMDGDDTMPSNRLRLMMDCLDCHPEPTLVSGLVQYFGSKETSPGYKKYEHWLNDIQRNQMHEKAVYRECFFASANWMMRAKDFHRIGGFQDLILPEDYDFALRCYQEGIRFVGIPELTLHWRHHPERTSLNHVGYSQASFFALKIDHFVKHQSKDRPLILWGENQKTRLTKRILRTHHRTFKVYRIDQYRNIENYTFPLLLITVYPGSQERDDIIGYLNQLNLTEGKDFWFV